MADEAAQPSIPTLTLTKEERDSLLNLLKKELGETRVEFHHTQNIDYRKQVRHQEDLFRGLIDKLDRLRL